MLMHLFRPLAEVENNSTQFLWLLSVMLSAGDYEGQRLTLVAWEKTWPVASPVCRPVHPRCWLHGGHQCQWEAQGLGPIKGKVRWINAFALLRVNAEVLPTYPKLHEVHHWRRNRRQRRLSWWLPVILQETSEVTDYVCLIRGAASARKNIVLHDS